MTVPCSAQCAPFKSSPATYATCCKQHAATAVAKRGVLKSRFPKPLTTGQLQQSQVQKVAGSLDQWKGNRSAVQNLNATRGDGTAPPTTTSSGGSGQIHKEIRCQTGCGGGGVVWAVVAVKRVHVFSTE